MSGDLELSALTPAEQSRLDELEHVVDAGLQTFVEVGRALLEIRDFRLYRTTHRTFESYCRERWSMGRRRGNQLVQAAQVVEVLGTTVPIPANEAQARELAPLLDDEAELLETWRELKRKHGDKVTARVIRRVVELRGADRESDALEARVDQADEDALRARWEFGRALLAEMRGKRLPPGRLDEVAALTGKTRREIRARMRFAERFPDEADLGEAIARFGSWAAVVELADLERRAAHPGVPPG